MSKAMLRKVCAESETVAAADPVVRAIDVGFGLVKLSIRRGGGYVLVKVGGEAVGGMMAAPPECAGMPPAWGVYVTVDDADAVARRVETLGGKLLRPPQDIPDVGRFCVLQDPQGATLCAMQYLKRA